MRIGLATLYKLHRRRPPARKHTHRKVLFVKNDASVRTAVLHVPWKSLVDLLAAHNEEAAVELLGKGEVLLVVFSPMVRPGKIDGIGLDPTQGKADSTARARCCGAESLKY